MKILGLYGCCGWTPDVAWLHSAGASLFIDGKHIVSISEERLSREKYDGNFPTMSIDYVLDAAEITKDDMTNQLKTAIHRFAKKQMTFFKNMEKNGIKINWIPEADFNKALNGMIRG